MLEQGKYLCQQLEILTQRHEVTGDLEAKELLTDVELVKDRGFRLQHHFLVHNLLNVILDYD